MRMATEPTRRMRTPRSGGLLLVATSVLVFAGSAVGGTAAAPRHRFVVPHLASGRLDSRLESVARAAEARGVPAALRSARRAGVDVVAGKLRVVVVARGEGSAAASAVAAAGGKAVMRAGRLVEALVAPSALRS